LGLIGVLPNIKYVSTPVLSTVTEKRFGEHTEMDCLQTKATTRLCGVTEGATAGKTTDDDAVTFSVSNDKHAAGDEQNRNAAAGGTSREPIHDTRQDAPMTMIAGAANVDADVRSHTTGSLKALHVASGPALGPVALKYEHGDVKAIKYEGTGAKLLSNQTPLPYADNKIVAAVPKQGAKRRGSAFFATKARRVAHSAMASKVVKPR
jgi:hypothetical protein